MVSQDMATADELLNEVRALGVQIWREGLTLCFDQPTKVPMDLHERLFINLRELLMRLPPPCSYAETGLLARAHPYLLEFWERTGQIGEV